MSTTGLDVFDTTLQKSNNWLKELQQELNWGDDRHRAYLALRSTLHALRDRLTPEEAVQLGAQFPMLIRGVYYDGWKMADTPQKIRNKNEFLSRIRHDFYNDPEIDPEQIVRAVFSLLSRKVSEGEIEDVRGIMPKELQDLWNVEVSQKR
ncbi:MAG: DUF2267 domain-containing protein [Candidatus Latescibacterota bacterium]